jgi:2-methylisocitrate lyase-like PEP mutase family enzyme
MVLIDTPTIDDTRRGALAARRRGFRTLHEHGCFVIPNPWDIGSARYLQHLGFKAQATTRTGFAFSQGLPDSDHVVSRDRSLSHIGRPAVSRGWPTSCRIPRSTGF